MESETKTTQCLSQAELRQHQLICVKALEIFDRICQENNIPYYLTCGTALGAVRHQGFIPWDDDIDVAILNSDRDALEKALTEGLGDDFELISERTCERFPRLHGKILYKKRNCLDMFQVARISENDLIASLQWNLNKIYLKVYYKKIGYDFGKENPVVGCIAKMLSMILSRKMILNLIEKNYSLCKKSNRWVSFNGVYPLKKEMLKPENLEDTEYAMFEGKEYRVIGHVKEFLRMQYGDYMKLPPKEKRYCTHLELFEDL